MLIGARLRSLREEKKLSRGDIEQRTGLLRCYICRVENGYTVPTVKTIEKFARALKVPIYRFFYEAKRRPEPHKPNVVLGSTWSTVGEEALFLKKFRRYLGIISEEDRQLLLYMAETIADREKTKRQRKKVRAA